MVDRDATTTSGQGGRDDPQIIPQFTRAAGQLHPEEDQINKQGAELEFAMRAKSRELNQGKLHHRVRASFNEAVNRPRSRGRRFWGHDSIDWPEDDSRYLTLFLLLSSTKRVPHAMLFTSQSVSAGEGENEESHPSSSSSTTTDSIPPGVSTASPPLITPVATGSSREQQGPPQGRGHEPRGPSASPAQASRARCDPGRGR